MSSIDSLTETRVTRRAWTGIAAACAVVAATGLALGFSAAAAEATKDKVMKMDEPMSGEMKKEGMKKGDVKQHAEKWDLKMKDMMEKEEKVMTQGDAKK